MIPFAVRHYDSVGSTNDEARKLADEGAPHGTVVCAREQHAGRGRQGRRWHSPEGNLYTSVLLRLGNRRIAELSFVAALAVADAVDAHLVDQRSTLKWPNDVLVRGAKISGILIEQSGDATVVGVGINVRHAPTGTPYPVTTLGTAATPGDVLNELLRALDYWLEVWAEQGFESIRAAWLARAHPPGTPIKIVAGEHSLTGHFADVAVDGSLLIDTDAGRKRIVAGDVITVASASSDPSAACSGSGDP